MKTVWLWMQYIWYKIGGWNVYVLRDPDKDPPPRRPT